MGHGPLSRITADITLPLPKIQFFILIIFNDNTQTWMIHYCE